MTADAACKYGLSRIYSKQGPVVHRGQVTAYKVDAVKIQKVPTHIRNLFKMVTQK